MNAFVIFLPSQFSQTPIPCSEKYKISRKCEYEINRKPTHKGQLLRVRSHFEIQSRWKTCPQFPQAMLRPSSEAELGLA